MEDFLNNVVKPLNCQAEDMSQEWESWKNQIEMLCKIKGIVDEEKKKDVLLLLGGLELQRICSNLPELEDEGDDINTDAVYLCLVKKLDRFFIQRKSKRFERHVFRKIRQLDNEKFDRYVMRLRIQALKCEWSLMQTNDNIVDQIVEGCLSDKLRIKVMEKDLDLEEVIKVGNSLESLQDQQKRFKQEQKSPLIEKVDMITNKADSNGKFANAICNRCGQTGHTGAYPRCPAKDKSCNKCKKVGHFANKCQSKRKPPQATEKQAPKKFRTDVGTREVNKIDEEELHYAFHLGSVDSIPTKIGGVHLDLIVDSGATVNVISASDWACLKAKNIVVSDQEVAPVLNLFAYGSAEPLKIVGSFNATIEVGQTRLTDRFYVIKEGRKSLMGNQLAKKLGILRINYEIDAIEEQKRNFPALKGVEVKVILDESVPPVFQPFRRLPFELQKKVSERLQELLDRDIIEKVPGHSVWASPLVVVPKSNGDIRLCVDMRRANKAIIIDSYPFPNVEDLMTQLNGAKCFSKIDIKDAYYQVRLAEDSREITTFITKGND